MTAPDVRGTGWPAWPEIIIAVLAVAATAAAGYAVAGPGAMALVVVAAAVISLVVLLGLVGQSSLASSPEDVSGPDPAVPAPVLSSFSRQWRRRSRLADARASMTAYEAGLRGQLEHLLASRLAERHGVSLYDDPDAARRVFTQGRPGWEGLWRWIEPAQAGPAPATGPALPTGPAHADQQAGPAQPGGPDGPGGPGRPGRPGRPADQPGIPYRTLARLIERLEHL